MTIPSAQTNRFSYSGDGVSTVFPYPSIFEDQDDLVVLLVDSDGNVTTESRGAEYSVTGGNGLSGSVTMVTAPVSGSTLIIYNDPPVVQQFDLVNDGTLPAAGIERAFDYATLLIQRLESRLGQFLSFPDSFVGTIDPILPQTLTAGDVLVVNSSGDGFITAQISNAYNPPLDNITLFPGPIVTGAGTYTTSPSTVVLGLAIGAHKSGFISEYDNTAHSDILWYLDAYNVGGWLWNRVPGTQTGLSTTGNTTMSSAQITNLASIANLKIGMLVTGSGIPAFARLFSIDSATAVTFTAPAAAGASATAVAVGLTFTDAGSAQMVVGSNVIPMGISCSGGSLSLNSADWAVPLRIPISGGNSFADELWIGADPGASGLFGSAIATYARQNNGLAGFTVFHNEARFNKNTVTTGNTVQGLNTITSVADTTDCVKGGLVSCANFPSGTTVRAISGSTITVSHNSTATSSSVACTFYWPSSKVDNSGGWTWGYPTSGNLHSLYGTAILMRATNTDIIASSGFLRFKNNVAFVAARNVGNTGDLTLTFNASDYLAGNANIGGIDLRASSGDFIGRSFWSGSSNIAQGGILRMANNEGIAWRNFANGADYFFKIDASNVMELNGHKLFDTTGQYYVANAAAGAGSADLSSACPAVDPTQPYAWIPFKYSDGSTVYCPFWK